MQMLRARYGGWTTDDLDAIPADGVRRELIDGVLLVTPSFSPAHRAFAGRLCATVNALSPPHYAVALGAEIRVGFQRSFGPDVVVVPREAVQRGGRSFASEEVALAVEIVSPASASIDRVLKPALYAAVGIPNYWRIEPSENYRLHAYALAEGGAYRDAGDFDRHVRVEQPWPMEFDLAALQPDER